LIRIMKTVMIGKEREGMLSRKGIMIVRKALPATLLVGALLVQSALAADAPQIYRESSDALYNLDFSTAQHGFEDLTRLYPQNADYWNALASTMWLKILYDQQKLDIDSYSGKSFGTRDSRDAVDPADEKKLRDTVATAMKNADAVLDKSPKDVRALYALGVANATLASFESTAKRAYFTAYGDAKTARNLHQQVLKLDPNFDDARMTVGIFDYVVDVIPPWFRHSLGLLLGMHGDGKQAGIEKIQTAAARGKQVSTDARMVLIVIYNREHRYDDAMELINELHSRYPRNFLFEVSKASIFGKMKRWDQAAQTYEQILQKIDSRKNGYERLRASKMYSSLGRSQVELHREDLAIGAFSRVVADSGATPNEKAEAHLWMGKVFDVKRDRTRALQHYDAVLGLSCDAPLKKEAAALKRKPFGAEVDK